MTNHDTSYLKSMPVFHHKAHPTSFHTSPPTGKLWNANYLRVMTGNFMLFFSFYLLTPLLPIYLDSQFGADKDTIGYVLSGYVVAALLVRPFSGYIVDAFDRKKVLTICFFCFFILFTGYVGAGTLLMFAIVRTIHGLPFGATTVANSTMAIDVTPSARRNEGVAFYGLSNNLAMALAPSAGIWLYDFTDDFSTLFYVSLAFAFVGFFTVSTIKHRTRDKVERPTKMSLDHFFLTRAWLLALNILLFGLCWGVMSNYVAIYAKEELNITDGTGLYFMILSVGLFLSRLIGVKSLRAGKLTENAIQGSLVSSIGYTLFAVSSAPWAFYTSAALIGLGNGRMYPAFLNMFISTARHDQRGTANSSILTSWDLGMGFGMLLGGVLTEFFGFDAAFYLTAASQILGTAILITLTRPFFHQKRIE